MLCSYTILPEHGGGFDFVPQRCPERPELCTDDDDDDGGGGAMLPAEHDEATEDEDDDVPSGAPATTTAAVTTLALQQPSQLLLATAPSVVSLTLEVRPPCLKPPNWRFVISCRLAPSPLSHTHFPERGGGLVW